MTEKVGEEKERTLGVGCGKSYSFIEYVSKRSRGPVVEVKR